MAKKAVKVSQIESKIDQLHGAVSTIAGWWRSNSEMYTPEGITAGYSKALSDGRFEYGKRAQQLNDLIDSLVPGAEAQAAHARAALAPTATDATQQLAAEMQAQRLLSRGNLKDVEGIMAYAREAEPSPALTIAMEEWQARGVIDGETIDAIYRDKSPEYQAAADHAGRTATMAGLLKARMRNLEQQMQTTREVETQYTPSVHAALDRGWDDTTQVDDIPLDTFSDVKVDPTFTGR